MPCLLANIVDYYRVASWTLSHSFIMASEAGRRLYKNYTFYFALLSFSSELCWCDYYLPLRVLRRLCCSQFGKHGTIDGDIW